MNSTALKEVIDADFSVLGKTFRRQQIAFSDNPYLEYQDRIRDLKNLKKALLEGEAEILEALMKDFGNRSEIDTKIGDVLTTILSINYITKHLKAWMKPSKRHVGLLFQPAQASVEYQPLGVVGIIVPWNYPIFLSMVPLATAIAAGNRAMIKMSEYTPETNKVLSRLLSKVFKHHQVAIVEGDAFIAEEFSNLPFNHIFFTGSTSVGKKVMQAASKNLVPVTLELGGKSPCIVDSKISLSMVVERLILGKTLNSGQTCVAPDYILCPRNRIDELVAEFRKRYGALYPDFENNKDVTSIINERQFQRLRSYLSEAGKNNAKVMPLAEASEAFIHSTRKIPLTLVVDAKEHSTLLQEEIFGPILPIIAYDSEFDAINYINCRDRPLALYIYSFDKRFQTLVTRNTHSGGVAINDAAFQVAMEDLPFGGVGPSGMGSCHGKEGFITFSHAKSILKRGKVSFGSLLFPPYSNLMHRAVFKLFIR